MFRGLMTYTAAVAGVLLIAGCATTEYQPFEAKENVFEGKGGTKVVVKGVEFWENGAPPRKFSILGIIDDQRPGGPLPMSQLRPTIANKVKEVGGDAVVQLTSQSELAGFYTAGGATANILGNSTTAYGASTTTASRRNVSKFAVIKFID